MDDTPDNDQILAALDHSGFLLEQRVAATLDAAGYAVRVSGAYVDPDENKNREIDVIAVKRLTDRDGLERDGLLVTTIECKSSPLPHVAFLRDWTDNDRKRLPWEVLVHKALSDNDAFVTDWTTHRTNAVKRAVQVVRIDRDGKGSYKARSDLYETGLPPIKAAYDLRKRLGGGGGIHPPRSILSFPAAIVGGELFSVEPGDYENPSLVAADFLTVSYENRSEWMPSNHLRSHYDIVKYASMQTWIEHIENVAGRVARHVPRPT